MPKAGVRVTTTKWLVAFSLTELVAVWNETTCPRADPATQSVSSHAANQQLRCHLLHLILIGYIFLILEHRVYT